MIAEMPRPRPPHLHTERNRHGTRVWYVRVGKGPRTRLRAPYGTPEFNQQYQDAIAGKIVLTATGNPAKGTFAWAVGLYRESLAWTSLSLATRRQRENILKHVLKSAGSNALTKIDTPAIVAGRDRRKATPFQARHFLATMRAFFKWAVQAGHAKADPTAGIAIVKPTTDGFEEWTDDEIAAFEKRWPRGTRERLMFDIFLYTGLRRGDAARLGRQHVRKGIISIVTEKTGETVTMPMLPELQKTIDAGPTGELTFIVSARGQPMRKEVVGNLFRVACRAAGIRKSAHGIRKAAASEAAENGATTNQLDALFGWRGGRMAAFYTDKADRARLAAASVTTLSRSRKKSGTSIPAPSRKVRDRRQKS